MLQRFSESARRVLAHAQEEAAQYGDRPVATEHVLLGLLREPEASGTRLLPLLGIPLARVRETTLQYQVASSEWTAHEAPRAQRVIELAYQETRQLGSTTIDTEHLLLALLRENQGLAGRILSALGLELEAVREAVKNPPSAPQPTRSTLPFPAVCARAQQEALQAGRHEVGPEHLLLGLLETGDAATLALLAQAELTPEQIREACDLPLFPLPLSPLPTDALPLTPAAQSALVQAPREAAWLGSATTAELHLFLALLRDPHGLVARVLSWLGLDYAQACSFLAPAPDPQRAERLRALGQQVLQLAPELAQASPEALQVALFGEPARVKSSAR